MAPSSAESADGVDRSLNCPNCGKRGFGDSGVPDGDIAECGNSNCSVFKFFYEGER